MHVSLDLVRATYDRRYEAAIIVSQDWDFGPAVRLAKEIAQAQGRRLGFESCSHGHSPTTMSQSPDNLPVIASLPQWPWSTNSLRAL